MKRLLFILLLLPLFLQGQEVITLNKKAIVTRYRQIPNNFAAWTAGTGSFTTVGANLPNGYIQCTSSGTAYIASTQAYGTWEFDIYKGADANTTTVYLTDNGSYTNCYTIVMGNTEFVGLLPKPGGYLSYSNVSYISNTTWYSFRITRTSTGVFTIYIKGGAFGNEWTLVSTAGGSGTNPVLSNTYTTSVRFSIDLKTSDRIRNVRFLPLNQNKLSEIGTRWRHIPNETSSFTVTAGSLTKVGTGTSAYLQAGATPTTAYFAYKQAYGTWEFDVYKQNVNNYEIIFISNSITPTQRYRIVFSPSETNYLYINASPLQTTTTSISSTPTWYSYKITRSSSGVFTTYIKGNAFGNEWVKIAVTGGSNPVTDNTYTTSSFFVIDIDNGDAIRNIRFKSLPLWP